MSQSKLAFVGAFVAGGILLFAVGLFLIGDRRLLFSDQFELNAEFGRVTGVQVGTKVRTAGLDAGEVLELQLPSSPSDRFVVRMRVLEELRPLVRADSIGNIQTDGLVGAAFIQISRGTDDAPMVSPGDTIAGRPDRIRRSHRGRAQHVQNDRHRDRRSEGRCGRRSPR